MRFFERKCSSRIFVRRNRCSRIVLATGVLGLVATALATAFWTHRPARIAPAPPRLAACPTWAEGRCEPQGNLFARAETEDPPREVLTGSIKPGQTLGGLLGDYVDIGELAALDLPEDYSFADLPAGQPYRMTLRDQELVAFEYDLSPTETLVIDATQGALTARLETKRCEVRPDVITGAIDSSLFAAVEAAGGDAETATALADVFACDIDFCRDVQPGDTFEAVVEKRYIEGRYSGLGRILAARFVNHGTVHEGFARIGPSGKPAYFDADGRPLRKAFLRAPLSFLRITSRFTASRLHPILKVRKPHFGVDYAAPTGTPVWTVGAGVVVERGRNKAAGNYVTVRHGATWVTRYNHLSRFAKGLAKGTKLAQGQVIGYVGQTGYATGPHLDFRIYKSGKPVNALANPQMRADPLPAAKLARFRREAARLAAFMERKRAVRDVADRDGLGTGAYQ